MMERRTVLVLSAVLLFVLLSQWVIFGVDRENWFDVSFSIQTAHTLNTKGWDSIDFARYDVHPPTYYRVLALWLLVPHGGITEYHWAMELGVVFGAFFILLAGLSLTSLFGTPGALATIALTLCTTYLHYFTEVRMYVIVLFSSALLFYAVAIKRMEGNWWIVATMTVAILPFVHYFASMAVFFYGALFVGLMLQRKEWNSRNKRRFLVFMALGIVSIVLAVLLFAAPQKSRVEGTWFAPPSLTEFPSALMYTIWMTDLYQPTGIVATVYMLLYMSFAVILGVMMWKSLNLIKKEMTETDVVMLFMGLTAIPPLMGLAAAPVFGSTRLGQGFAHLYHPRFFLILDWLFAALLFVLVAKYVVSAWEKLNLVRATIVAGSVFLVLVWMIFVYATQISHHELRNLMVQAPCPKGNDPSIQIAHESAFSSLPFDVYAREVGCNWVNFISTNMTPKMAAGGGFDALPASDVYYNKTLPKNKDDYYYVYAAGTVPIDGVPQKVALEDGVELWFIKRDQTDRSGQVASPQYDNSTETQYTRMNWNAVEVEVIEVPQNVYVPENPSVSSDIKIFVNVTNSTP